MRILGPQPKRPGVLRTCCRERRQRQRISHSYYPAGLLFDGRKLRNNHSRRVYLTSVVGVLLINLATPLRFVIADPRGWQGFSEWIARCDPGMELREGCSTILRTCYPDVPGLKWSILFALRRAASVGNFSASDPSLSFRNSAALRRCNVGVMKPPGVCLALRRSCSGYPVQPQAWRISGILEALHALRFWSRVPSGHLRVNVVFYELGALNGHGPHRWRYFYGCPSGSFTADTFRYGTGGGAVKSAADVAQ